MKFTLVLLLILSLFSSLPIDAQVDRGAGVKPKDAQPSSEKRLALVIGNSTYSNTTPLVNPANDATDMTAALKSLGFEVLSGTNQSKKQMEALIRTFGDKLAKQGGVGLFFYAGHGLQVNGNNYLVPVEAEIPAQDEVEYATINLGFLLGKMEAAQNDLNIVILDACRNNPFARSWRSFRDIGEGKGLAKITPPTGTIMLYATQPGNVASDGAGRNGLFTESLLKQITKPGVELDAMVKLLARDVSEKSGKKQLPWKEGIVLGDFYFVEMVKNNLLSASSTQVTNKQSEKPQFLTGEQSFWQETQKQNTLKMYQEYLYNYPKGEYTILAKIKISELEIKEANNNDALKHYQSCISFNISKQYSEAIKECTTAITINPEYGEAYASRASAYNQKGESQKAIDDYTNAIKFNPIEIYSFKGRAEAYHNLRMYIQEIDDLTTAIKLNPDDYFLYFSRAEAYGKVGRRDLAAADRRKMGKLNNK